MNPLEAIDAGRKILDPVMTAAGFAYEPASAGNGSGGPFAAAAYVRDDRRMSFSYRWAIGDVQYQIGSDSLEHMAYMRSLGHYFDAHFAAFSREVPMAGFVALAHDLKAFAADFLRGKGVEFRRFATQLAGMPDGRLPAFLP